MAVNVEVFDEETENDEMAAGALDVVHKSETVDETELERGDAARRALRGAGVMGQRN